MEDFMARTKTQGTRSSRRKKGTGSLLEKANFTGMKNNITGYDYRNLFERLRGNTLLVNAGVGVGAFYLVKYAIRYYKGHPQIADFIKENLDTVESKFREYRTTTSGENTDANEARH